MRYFNKINHAKNLPDTYRKDKDSNNYKILETERSAGEELNRTLGQIFDILDLDNATGSTLDLYGEKVGQARGEASDDQYRIMIRAKAVRNLADGSYPSILRALCITFGCDESEFKFEDSANSCTVQATVFPVTTINEAGFTALQAMAIIKSLLPICVTLDPITVDGTFIFADGENEYDENAGFTDVEGGTIGGTLSTIYGTENEYILPV